MYRYTDTTYPLYEVVSMETSLYEAVGLVTFRFELVQAVGRVTAYDSFKVKALYKLRDRAAVADFAVFLAESLYSELTESSENILIKNPHSSSFLLGASGPANTALGGRTYA